MRLLGGLVLALVLPAAPSHATTLIYLNSCAPAGCAVTPGPTDARTDQSDLVQRIHQLSPWGFGPGAWGSMVSCVRSVMAPFDIEVTDVDPGPADHLEVMIAGTPQQFGVEAGVGGLADIRCSSVGHCSSSIPNALAFVFADVWNGNVIETCASVAQQLGHTWALDHVIDARDPMSVIRGDEHVPSFRDGQICGSDCVAGFSQFGLACTGAGTDATHTCIGTGAATQDEVQAILAIVGPSQVSPPTLALRSPLAGAIAMGGVVAVDCTSNDGTAVAEVDLTIDGEVVAQLGSAPYEVSLPAALSSAAHTIAATCTTAIATASVSTTVSVGPACVEDADCVAAGDVCDAGACIPGSNSEGGLGTSCKTSSDCASQLCESQGWGKTYCVVACTMDTASCPAGFACFAADGQTAGACWSVAGGGCDASGRGSTGSTLVIIAFACLKFRRSHG